MGLRGQHDDPCTPRRGAPGRPARRGPAVAALVALVAGLVACGGGDGEGGEDAAGDTPAVEWVRVGYDLANTRAVEDEAVIGPGNVGELAPAWEVTGLAGVSGTPAVVDGTVYLGDWTGHVRALDAASGEELWAQQVSPGYIGGSVAVDGDRVLAGTFDARLVALDRTSGEVIWETDLDEHPKAVVFGSPIVVDGLVVAGVGSYEVFAPGDPSTFRGSVVALDAETGEERWRFWTTAGDATEGPGVSVWSSPAVDTERGVLYVGTGQGYAPPAPPRSDALVALDLETGEEVWATQFTAGDTWTIRDPTGADADVGAMPNLFTVDGVDAVGVGDKAGTYRALDRETGEVLWERHLTEGGLQGGVMASAAVADGTIYVASNEASQDAVLFALDADTGEEVWRTEVGAHVTGPVTWANDVLYLADDAGGVAAYAAEDGERLWRHEVDFPAAGGVAVVEGTVYAGWGWWLAGAPEGADGGIAAFRLAEGEGDDGDLATGGDGGDGPDGAEIYRGNCATCHGGSGQGGVGPGFEGIGDRLTVEEQIEVVREGRGRMPAWEDELSPEEIEAVVAYIDEELSGG